MDRKTIRVLYISSGDAGTGGSGKSLCEMVELLKKGYNVDPIVINTNHNNLNHILDQAGIENFSAGYKMNICQEETSKIKTYIKYIIKRMIYCITTPISLLKIERTLDLNSVDVIHINNSTQDIGALLGKKYNIPVVWHIREFGEKDFNFLYFRQDIARYISDSAAKVIAISDAIKKDWVEKGIDSRKVVTIMHGINPEGIHQADHKNKKIRIIFSGKIIKQKGQEAFIDSLVMLPDKTKNIISVDFFGTGDAQYLSFLNEKVDKLNLKQVVCFKGYNKNIKEELQNYDIGVVNSRCEGMGRITIEYMAAGLCVLASNRGANLEIIDNEKTGYIYDIDDSSSLTQLIESLCNDKNKILLVGENARRKALSQYSIKNNVWAYRKIYDEIVWEKHRNVL